MSSYEYLLIEDVLDIHREQIETFGGSPGVRDLGLIEAALLRPQTGYYDGLLEEAAALWESLAMNHGFVDGNKRIGAAAMGVFLAINGTRVTAPPGQLAAFVLARLEEGTFRFELLVNWLAANTESI